MQPAVTSQIVSQLVKLEPKATARSPPGRSVFSSTMYFDGEAVEEASAEAEEEDAGEEPAADEEPTDEETSEAEDT